MIIVGNDVVEKCMAFSSNVLQVIPRTKFNYRVLTDSLTTFVDKRGNDQHRGRAMTNPHCNEKLLSRSPSS